MHAKLAAIAIIAAVLVSACALPEPGVQTTTEHKDILSAVPHTDTELLYNDLLSTDFVSTDITVLGVTVGMSEDDLKAKLGTPDQIVESDFGGVRDYLFGKSLGLQSTGFIFHVEKGTVTRIIVKYAAHDLLQGASQPGRTKAELYSTHGPPDRVYDFAFQLVGKPAEVDGVTGRFYVYNEQGFESYHDRKGEYQYAFVYPNRKLPTTAYETRMLSKDELLHPALPVLMTDTTTLCNQGPTYAYTLSSAECKPFPSACEIPDNWIEIRDCANRPAYVPENNTSTNGSQ